LPIDRIKRSRALASGGGRGEGLSVSSWPGLSRPSTSMPATQEEDVDPRHKAGHDELLNLPSIVVAKEHNALVISSLDDAAARYGLSIGQPLANARALCPDVQ